MPKKKDIGSALAEALRVCPGVSLALLVDGEGMVVDTFSRETQDVDAEEVAAEAVASCAGLSRLASCAGLGGEEEWLIRGSEAVMVVRRLPGSQMRVMLRASDRPFLGRVRFSARVISARLAELLG